MLSYVDNIDIKWRDNNFLSPLRLTQSGVPCLPQQKRRRKHTIILRSTE